MKPTLEQVVDLLTQTESMVKSLRLDDEYTESTLGLIDLNLSLVKVKLNAIDILNFIKKIREGVTE